MWVHSNPLMSHAGVTFISPPVVTPPSVATSVSFTGYITMLWVRPLEMCLDPYKNWIQVDPVFEFLKLLLCCDVALSSPIPPSCSGPLGKVPALSEWPLCQVLLYSITCKERPAPGARNNTVFSYRFLLWMF